MEIAYILIVPVLIDVKNMFDPYFHLWPATNYMFICFYASIMPSCQFCKTKFFGFFQPNTKFYKLITQYIWIWSSTPLIFCIHIFHYPLFIFLLKIQSQKWNT